MRDGDDAAAGGEVDDRAVGEFGALGVEVRRRFIEQNDRFGSEECSRDADSGSLPCGESEAVVTDPPLSVWR